MFRPRGSKEAKFAVPPLDGTRPLNTAKLTPPNLMRPLTELPDNAVAPQIVTGVEGLGRASETQRLDMLVANVGQLFGPETVAKTFNPRAYMRRKAAGLSLDVGDLVYTEEQAAQMQQQAMLAQATEKLGPSLIGAMSKGAEQPQQTPQEGA